MRREAAASIAGSTKGSGRRRALFGMFCLCVLGLTAVLGTGASSAGAVGACPNEEFRAGLSSHLAGCRAYEQVSPVDKSGSDINIAAFGGPPEGEQPIWQAATGGDAVAYVSRGAFAGSLSALPLNPYLSERDAGGWSTRGISAPMNSSNMDASQLLARNKYEAYSPDLSVGVLSQIGPNGPELAPGAVHGYPNLYLRDLSASAYTAVTTVTPPNFPPQLTFVNYRIAYQGASADYSHVVFWAPDALTPDAPDPCEACLYEWTNGQLRLVNVLPNGTPTAPANLGGGGGSSLSTRNVRHAVSVDGSTIYWTAAVLGVGDIYVRIDGTTTFPVGTGQFWAASPDGEHAIYTLDPGNGDGRHLYRFDLATGESADLTPAGEVAGVVGESDDLSYIYFVANEKMYVHHEGANTFITTPGGTGLGNSADNQSPVKRTSYVTPDGRHLAFVSNSSLTGYDNTPADPSDCILFSGKSGPCAEVFDYDATTEKLTCASCNPSGARPQGHSTIQPWYNQSHQPRALSNDGAHLFFNSSDVLAPGDTNDQQDVYEWRSGGTGDCTGADGCVNLISGGSGGAPDPTSDNAPVNYFVDASASGGDVFFTTAQRLVTTDPDGASDLYDARENGGLASQDPPPEQECEGDGCRGASSAPEAAAPTSAALVGRGNLKQASRCAVTARRAQQASRKAKRLRGQAKTVQRTTHNRRRVKRLRRKAHRLAGEARKLSGNAKRCRRARSNRRAGG